MHEFCAESGRYDDMTLPVIDRLSDLVELVADRSGLFVRFSDGPDADSAEQSVDYESGLPLPGLSANRLNPAPWWTRPLIDWVARQVCQYAHLRDRSESHRGWVLTGDVVGRGPDDEPLIADIHPIAWLSTDLVDEADAWYAERFERGSLAR
jgi:hypothetical protein